MKASEFIKRKNSDYGIYDNETGLRVIDALLRSSIKKPLRKPEKTKLTLIDNELKKLQQYNEDTQRQRILKAFPHANLKGTARYAYLKAKHDTQDRERNEDLAVKELVGKYLDNLARIDIQQRAAKKINRIKQNEKRTSSNNAVRKLKNHKKKTPRLEIFPRG
jgi:hypothetical protein